MSLLKKKNFITRKNMAFVLAPCSNSCSTSCEVTVTSVEINGVIYTVEKDTAGANAKPNND